MAAEKIEQLIADVRQLFREEHAERAALQARYDVACEVIANHLEGGSTDRARAMVERQYRIRAGLVEERAP